MNHFEEARDLVKHAEGALQTLRAAYQASLNERLVRPELKINIKNLMENLRSALDFSAHGLYDK